MVTDDPLCEEPAERERLVVPGGAEGGEERPLEAAAVAQEGEAELERGLDGDLVSEQVRFRILPAQDGEASMH
jgi:hypothetical protein